MQTIKEALESERRIMEIYDRVHAELEDGRAWEDIDNGTGKTMSYEYWFAYMQQRFTNKLRALLLLSKHEG